MKIKILYYPISIFSHQILVILSLFIELIKDLDGEINVIELVENSKDPYIVFNEKEKGGFTREELEIHFQTLSDLIMSDKTAAKSRKKAAIQKLDKMRDELVKDAKDNKSENGPAAEDDELENDGPLADSENVRKGKDKSNEGESKENEGEEANNGPNENEQAPADEEEGNGNANEEEGPKDKRENANSDENEEKDKEEENGPEEGPTVNSAENNAAEQVGPSEKSKENGEEEENDEEKEVKSKEEDEERKKEEKISEEGPEDGTNEAKKKGDGSEEEERIGPKPTEEEHIPSQIESSEPKDEKPPSPPKSPKKDEEETDESGPSVGLEYSNEESGPNEEEKTTTMKPRRKTRHRRPKGDIALNCRRHIHQCFQEEYRAGMAIYCKGTCGQLGKRNVDIGTNCRELAREGFCSDGMWGDKMYKYCHRSCTRLRG